MQSHGGHLGPAFPNIQTLVWFGKEAAAVCAPGRFFKFPFGWHEVGGLVLAPAEDPVLLKVWCHCSLAIVVMVISGAPTSCTNARVPYVHMCLDLCTCSVHVS